MSVREPEATTARKSARKRIADWAARHELLVVCGIAITQFALLWWLLGHAAPMPPDTLEHAAVARNLLRGAGYTIDLVEIHPGLLPNVRHLHELHGLLQPLLIAPSFELFGVDLHWALLPSVGLSAATFVATFCLGRRTHGSAAGWLAAAMVLGWKGFAFAAALGADDVGWTFFSTAAIAAFLSAVETGRDRWLVLAGGLAGLATLQKLTGFMLSVAFTAAFVLVPSVARRFRVRGWVFAVGPAVLAVALYTLRNYALHGGLGFRFSAVDWLSKNDPAAYFAYYERAPSLLDALAAIGPARIAQLTLHQFEFLADSTLQEPILLIGPLALLSTYRENRTFFWVGLVYTILIVGTTCIVYHVESRYLFGLYPIYFVAIAVAAVTLSRKLPSNAGPVRAGLAAVAAALACVGAGAVGILYRNLGTMAAGAHGQCEDAMAFLGRSMAPGDAVLTSSPWYVGWATERAAVAIPTNGVVATQTVARHYGARWLVTGLPSIYAADAGAAVESLIRQASPLRPVVVHRGPACDVYRFDGE